ncbi:MAG: hypothetical protein KVP17_000048 [Porospora cf. gigantea B]|uniref:uncharacterized protein n=1 Tax=Porospora cf. gigantea B TaxID=2853592 RepID=UPI003571D3BE|nr:MAG: hypothetical protein KVP17_000048 [Porospora cf. gigantea B]
MARGRLVWRRLRNITATKVARDTSCLTVERVVKTSPSDMWSRQATAGAFSTKSNVKAEEDFSPAVGTLITGCSDENVPELGTYTSPSHESPSQPPRVASRLVDYDRMIYHGKETYRPPARARKYSLSPRPDENDHLEWLGGMTSGMLDGVFGLSVSLFSRLRHMNVKSLLNVGRHKRTEVPLEDEPYWGRSFRHHGVFNEMISDRRPTAQSLDLLSLPPERVLQPVENDSDWEEISSVDMTPTERPVLPTDFAPVTLGLPKTSKELPGHPMPRITIVNRGRHIPRLDLSRVARPTSSDRPSRSRHENRSYISPSYASSRSPPTFSAAPSNFSGFDGVYALSPPRRRL